jgi:glycosyltransferase involved in cell wall biosynthesis
MTGGIGIPPKGKLRIGLYGSSPIVGGAELYFKDLLWRVDRNDFDVTLYYLPWPQFDRFLAVDKLRATTFVCPVRVKEVGSPFTTDRGTSRARRHMATARKRLVGVLSLPVKVAAATVLRYLYLPYNVAHLYRVFRRYPVDVLHINNGGYPGAVGAQAAAIAAKLAGCRRCVMIVANTPFVPQFPRVLEHLVDGMVMRAVDRFLAMTPTLARLLAENRGVSPAQIEVIPYGAEDPPPETGVIPIDPVRRPRVVMVAQFLKHKGHVHLLKAVARIGDAVPGLTVTFVGGGPARPEVESLAATLGISGQVEFAGYLTQDQVFERIRESDVFVLPSEMEGMPYAILHAMSLGKAVVSTRVGGIPDFVVDGVTGILTEPRDVEALAAALETLLKDVNVAEAMGAAGRREFEERYTVHKMVSDYEKLYKRLAAPMQAARR